MVGAFVVFVLLEVSTAVALDEVAMVCVRDIPPPVEEEPLSPPEIFSIFKESLKYIYRTNSNYYIQSVVFVFQHDISK